MLLIRSISAASKTEANLATEERSKARQNTYRRHRLPRQRRDREDLGGLSDLVAYQYIHSKVLLNCLNFSQSTSLRIEKFSYMHLKVNILMYRVFESIEDNATQE